MTDVILCEAKHIVRTCEKHLKPTVHMTSDEWDFFLVSFTKHVLSNRDKYGELHYTNTSGRLALQEVAYIFDWEPIKLQVWDFYAHRGY